MDTSGTPNESSNESPWSNTKPEVNKQTAPPIAAFDGNTPSFTTIIS